MKTTIGAGIVLSSLSYFLFAVHDSMIKLLVETTTVWQILFCRSIAILTGCLIMGGRGLVRETLTSTVRRPMMIRSLFLLSAWLCYFHAAKFLPLADLTTLYFAAPIVAVVLSIPMLGEHVSFASWAAVVTGFVGVIVASDPTGMADGWPVYLAILAACCWAIATILLRRTSQDASSMVQMAMTNVFFLALTAPVALSNWTMPAGGAQILLVAVGVIGGMGQLAYFESMRRAPISIIAPFEYTALIWAFALGYAIWGDIPGRNVVAGAVLIASAGVIILVAERRRATA
ncbi:DMT family transporter [Rhizobium glycinendophyticum]|uniref:DMT family transporter n=1 Tax=Rhizobium glycinendophyticum TaxID=2589807 RepID=A0A504UC22_9HYPH|nr:DMT family transporter [Rhizobium glycinendophyticum]TPP07146.1 DMT family transporter [Rhizobium glycinendophyticum]